MTLKIYFKISLMFPISRLRFNHRLAMTDHPQRSTVEGCGGNGSNDTYCIIFGHFINVNAEDEKGQTPLHWTAFSNSNAIQILLKQKGVNVNAKTKAGGTILHPLAEGTGIDASLLLKRIRMMVKIEGVDLNLRDSSG
jgi:hypothetical protein